MGTEAAQFQTDCWEHLLEDPLHFSEPLFRVRRTWASPLGAEQLQASDFTPLSLGLLICKVELALVTPSYGSLEN